MKTEKMKFFDCIISFDEPLLYDIRLNILSKYVDNFVISEAKFTHIGEEKKIPLNKFRTKSEIASIVFFYQLARLVLLRAHQLFLTVGK